MRWLFRIALTLAFLGLIALAIMPYLPRIQKESLALYEAWQQVRSAEPSAEQTKEQTSDVISETARRTVIVPGKTPETTSPSDPLLAEARRRAETDPEAAMSWLQTQANSPQRLRGMLEVVALWAAEDSEGALLWLESNAQGIARLETLSSGVTQWAQQDPITASEWVEGMANDASKVTAAKALASNWANSNPNEAAKWVDTLPQGTLRDEAADALITSWINTDPEQASIWALSEAALNGNQDLLNLSIEQYTKASTIEAEAFLRGVTEAYDAPEAIKTFIRTRAQDDPAEAMNWHMQLSDGDSLNQADNARVIMQEWSRTDSVAASAWLSTQTLDAERDNAILGFNDTMLAFEPEAATAWANTISDPAIRTERLTESIQQWARSQPVEALAWVKNTELDPDLRTALASEIGAD